MAQDHISIVVELNLFRLRSTLNRYKAVKNADIAILNDSTRYQAEPGNADPEALPRL